MTTARNLGSAGKTGNIVRGSVVSTGLLLGVEGLLGRYIVGEHAGATGAKSLCLALLRTHHMRAALLSMHLFRTPSQACGTWLSLCYFM
jgi:hypothetical protein